jgi:glycine cleavage system H protein
VKRYLIQKVENLVKVNDYEVPEGLYYSKDHMWVRLENTEARIGITQYAQKQMRDIVYVELPSSDETLELNEPFGTVESVKAVSDLIAPLSGVIERVNDEAVDRPELLNEDPYGEGWLLIMSPSKIKKELTELMDFTKAVEWHKELVKEA